MQKREAEHFSAYPQILVDFQWPENELHDVDQGEVHLEWKQQRRCVEHRFSQDWEVEYYVLEHWAEHVGARFNMTKRPTKRDFTPPLSTASFLACHISFA
ncbi:MAG: hypothetical protein IBX43_05910 [Campylobacterales bacterium]|nr:hypothetical protein [Campylobacterales bacterium]